ncbi:MAG: ABC transporter ATP-binding protein [Betaproteobacteria bacterium RIFCSPLOWO2_12_FULL_66_14]|nr:MAG: ABC transporter ATP-binding protein [Betaproteobacteria bacterium RIFCSPLOWO2_12_FULL_66_14]
MNLLRTENLTKSFGSLIVTKDVNLVVKAGERHALIGPNGAGKTSLVHQIGGQLRPTSGRIYFKDVDITGASPERICQLGVGRTFQRNNLFRGLSVRENVRLAVQAKRGRLYDGLTDIGRRSGHFGALWARADQILEQVRLTEGPERPVSSLSYGEQRQLEIAIALASEPQLLLLDEPTSGMSPLETERMSRLIESLPAELGLLMIEHDMAVAFSLAHRITVLYYGEILASGAPDEISNNRKVRDVYLGGKH